MQQLLDPTPCTLGKFLKVVGGSLSWKAFEPCALNLEEGSQPVVYISPLALASRSRLSLSPLSPASLSLASLALSLSHRLFIRDRVIGAGQLPKPIIAKF